MTALNEAQFGTFTSQGWLEKMLAASKAEWQIVITHFPPFNNKNKGFWARLARKYGIDLIVTGHSHYQNVWYYKEFTGWSLEGTAWVITGGGGGITSERTPVHGGNDDAYGF